jgi:hypothetical protein
MNRTLKFTGLLVLILVPFLQACASSGEAARPRGNPDLITRDQIEVASAQNAFELVRQVRPQWLRGRGPTSIQSGDVPLPIVYVGEMRHGELESLRVFELSALQELRYISATAATTRYGSGHSGGVIRVTLRNQ